MKENIFFKSAGHKQRLTDIMQQLGKIDTATGKYDPEYLSALYILTADAATWHKASDYVSREGIDIEVMLQEVDLSGGYTILVQFAGNLFNSEQHIDPVELMRLDEANFLVALNALMLRRFSVLAPGVY